MLPAGPKAFPKANAGLRPAFVPQTPAAVPPPAAVPQTPEEAEKKRKREEEKEQRSVSQRSETKQTNKT